MREIPESGWLFTRGLQSVRLVREETLKGCRLFVHGPGTEVVTYECADLAEGMKRQGEIELGLLAAGFQLAHTRRGEQGDWGGQDHRRTAS